jgi:hypothetical protein
MISGPFIPKYGSGIVISATATASTGAVAKDSKCIKVSNSGTGVAYFRVGDSLLGNATNADCAVLPGESRIVVKHMDHTVISVMAPVSATLSIISGEGGQ